MYKLIRRLLYLFPDPETSHYLAVSFLKILGYSPFKQIAQAFFTVKHQALEQNIFGLNFKNPVGLAAGFDKNAQCLPGLEALGFGFLEVGTVTRFPQPGNPRQRLFRFPEDQALINRMGFNNKGADSLAMNLASSNKLTVPLGINLGKSKITELTDATQDYLYSFKALYGRGDYFIVNISSPNTPGLRQLQDKLFLEQLLASLINFRSGQKIRKPIFIKIVIDFTLEAVDEILAVCQKLKIDGIITSNTTISIEGLKFNPNEMGGLSGRPITQKSTELIKYIYKQKTGLPIIGVGGIFTAQDAYDKIRAGASLAQVYTGLIYEGPAIVKNINGGLVKLLARDGFKNIAEAVGAG